MTHLRRTQCLGIAAALGFGGTACAKNKPHACFEVAAGANSASTRAVFAERKCQGGGVTWAALLQVLADRRGQVEAVETATPGWTGAVYTLGGARFSLDDEGDTVQFCADDPALHYGLATQDDLTALAARHGAGIPGRADNPQRQEGLHNGEIGPRDEAHHQD